MVVHRKNPFLLTVLAATHTRNRLLLAVTLGLGYHLTFSNINFSEKNDAENFITERFNTQHVNIENIKTNNVDTGNVIAKCEVQNVVVPSSSHRKGTRAGLGDEEYISNAEVLIKSLQIYLSVGKSPFTDMPSVPSLVDVNQLYKIFHGKTVLDFGCGGGRMLTGLQSLSICYKKYVGVDVSEKEIDYLKTMYNDENKHLFLHSNVKNARYNPKGNELTDGSYSNHISGLENMHGSFDVIHLRSVFSHMTLEEIDHHLKLFRSYLKYDPSNVRKSGVLVVSLFVRDDMKVDEEENPNEYETNNSPLHKSVISSFKFLQLLQEADFHILFMSTFDIQDTYVLAPGQKPNK